MLKATPRWLGLLLEIYLLLTFVNLALLLPYPWDTERCLLTAASVVASGACSYFTSISFYNTQRELKHILFAPPFVLWWGVTGLSLLSLMFWRVVGR